MPEAVTAPLAAEQAILPTAHVEIPMPAVRPPRASQPANEPERNVQPKSQPNG